MQCNETEKCEECNLSEWSEWSDCTKKCGGVSKRFRNFFGKGCSKNETESEVKQCDECTCTVDGMTYEVCYIFNQTRSSLYIYTFIIEQRSNPQPEQQMRRV